MTMGPGALGAVGGGIPFQLLDGVQKTGGASKVDATEGAGGGADGGFAGVLKAKLQDLNAQQTDASKASEDMATGRVDDVAQTMMRIEQANVSLQMATQVRNKVIEAYQEVLRMQM